MDCFAHIENVTMIFTDSYVLGVHFGKRKKLKSSQLFRSLKHGLWVSLLHPAFSGQCVDYLLGNLESKLISLGVTPIISSWSPLLTCQRIRF
jgi:hypothetical protein